MLNIISPLPSFRLTYAKAGGRSDTEKSYTGTLKTDVRGMKINGVFNIDKTHLTRARDGEEGPQITANLEIKDDSYPLKLSFIGKSTNMERRYRIKACNQNDEECRTGDFHLQHIWSDNGDLKLELKAVSEAMADGKTTTEGLSVKMTATDRWSEVEHVGKFILGRDGPENVGYRLYRTHKEGSEHGAEILLPQRTIATVLTATRQNHNAMMDLSFYMDRTKQPERKVSLIFNVARMERNSEGAKERQTELIFRHPDMPKVRKPIDFCKIISKLFIHYALRGFAGYENRVQIRIRWSPQHCAHGNHIGYFQSGK